MFFNMKAARQCVKSASDPLLREVLTESLNEIERLQSKERELQDDLKATYEQMDKDYSQYIALKEQMEAFLKSESYKRFTMAETQVKAHNAVVAENNRLQKEVDELKDGIARMKRERENLREHYADPGVMMYNFRKILEPMECGHPKFAMDENNVCTICTGKV